MEFIEILAYVGALFIGLVLGLIGGGGSILTVPILVYALSLDPVMATAYSLFVVGTTSLAGAIQHIKKQMINFKIGIIFAIPAFTAVYLTRAFLIPVLPDDLFTLGSFMVTKDLAIMLFFAVVMLMASVAMIKDNKQSQKEKHQEIHYPILILQAFGVGMVTGLVGAGGGFLIVPALMFLAGIPIKKAIATSLFIIAINSLIGFLGDVQNLDIDWTFLLSFTVVSVVGIFLGMWLNRFIDGKKLKKGFGWFVLIMGVYIIFKELAG
jgi:uncharacterized membrane protein YfcA